ncbi:HEAT repeat domain-containing protein [Elusimicrobiota bacterium]
MIKHLICLVLMAAVLGLNSCAKPLPNTTWDTNKLIDSLVDENPKARIKARGILLERGSRASKVLVNYMQDEDVEMRKACVMLLGDIGHKKSAVPLSMALNDESDEVFKAAQDAIMKIGDNAVDEYIAVFNNAATKKGLTEAAFALILIGEQSAEPIINVLIGKNDTASARMADALKEVGAPAVDLLAPLLGHKKERMRDGTAYAFILIGDPALEALINALESNKIRTRRTAVYALGEIKDPQTIPYLVNRLEDTDWTTMAWSSLALAKFGKQALDPLLAALNSRKASMRLGAAYALGELRDRRAIPALKKKLRDPDSDVRKTAKLALEKLQ